MKSSLSKEAIKNLSKIWQTSKIFAILSNGGIPWNLFFDHHFIINLLNFKIQLSNQKSLLTEEQQELLTISRNIVTMNSDLVDKGMVKEELYFQYKAELETLHDKLMVNPGLPADEREMITEDMIKMDKIDKFIENQTKQSKFL